MKLLVGGAKTKFFHLKEFCDALTKFGVEYKLVHDVEIYDGFPSRNFSSWFQSKKKFKKLIDEFRPDAIFIDRQRHFALAATESRIPSFMLLRGDYWSEMEWAKETIYRAPHKRYVLSQWDKIAKKCFANSTVILPICRYLQNIVKDRLPAKKTEILYGGIDSSRWFDVKPMELRHPCVGLLQGAWIWGKTKEMLTLGKVMEAMPDVTFYWAGDGPYRRWIVEELGKYRNFEWLGSLGYPDGVREYLAGIDVYALASGIDMSPLTLQEAQLMKKPVVATNVGGIPELMIDGKTGFLVERENHIQWIEKLTFLLGDKTVLQDMGKSGREFIQENFSWEKIAKDFIEIAKPYLK